MITYTYIVKCPECEDEFFDFFDEAKEFALGCLTKKPIITQTEVTRNDFGECTDHCDLGTVWSWEDLMQDTESEDDTVFSKNETFGISEGLDDFDDFDIGPQSDEFDFIDNSVDFEIEDEPLKEAATDELQPGVVYTLKDDAFICAAEDSSIKGFLSNPTAATIAHVKNTYTKGEDIIIPKGTKLRFVKETLIHNIWYCMFSDSKVVFLFSHSFANHLITEAVETRKSIPEGMTIEQLVEEMEEYEDTVECKWCQELFPKEEGRFETGFGGLICRSCQNAAYARGEKMTYKDSDYWDFLDEDITAERSTEELVRDSINHLVNDLGKDSDAEDFADDVILDIERNYDNFVPETPENYSKWASAIACEVSRQLNEKLDLDIDFSQVIDSSDMEIWGVEPVGDATYKAVLLKRFENVPFRGGRGEIEKVESEMFDIGGLFVFHFGKDGLPKLGRWDPELLNSLGNCEIIFDDESYDRACEETLNKSTSKTEELESETVRDLGNTYDGGYPAEPAEIDEVSDSHLKLCPECGKETFDLETGVCVECGFN